MLDCPIIGVARNEWSAAGLASTPARHRGQRRDHRRGRLPAPGGAPLHGVGRLHGPEDLRPIGPRPRGPARPCLLPRDPALPVRPGGRGPGRRQPHGQRPGGGGEAVRPRPGFGPGLERRAAQRPRRMADSSHRPLPGQRAGHGHPVPPVRQLHLRTPLESGPHPGVQITMAEDFGVEDRGSFYDPVGALRDVVQNHLLQLIGLFASEPPAPSMPTACETSGSRCSGPCPPADPRHYVRGQYDGYLSVPGVKPGSQTETFAALRLEIDNWRWSGVPFFIRAGKALAAHATEMRIIFKPPPHFCLRPPATPYPDELVLRIDPNPGADLVVQAKKPGAQTTRTVDLSLIFSEELGDATRTLRAAPRRRPAGRRQPVHPGGQRGGDLADRGAPAGLAAAGRDLRAGVMGTVRGRQTAGRAPPLAGAVATFPRHALRFGFLGAIGTIGRDPTQNPRGTRPIRFSAPKSGELPLADSKREESPSPWRQSSPMPTVPAVPVHLSVSCRREGYQLFGQPGDHDRRTSSPGPAGHGRRPQPNESSRDRV